MLLAKSLYLFFAIKYWVAALISLAVSKWDNCRWATWHKVVETAECACWTPTEFHLKALRKCWGLVNETIMDFKTHNSPQAQHARIYVVDLVASFISEWYFA